jgi:hypothetical protein
MSLGRRLLRLLADLEVGQVLLGLERGHAAHAGRGDRLPVDVVGDVARRFSKP